MKTRLTVIVSVLGLTGACHAQALFSAGKTSPTILLAAPDNATNQLLFASQNSAIHLSYDSPTDIGPAYRKFHWGFDFSANSTGNNATVFQNNSLGTAGAAQLSIRRENIFFKGHVIEPTTNTDSLDPYHYDELGITGGVSTETDNLYDTGTTSFDTKRFTGWNGALNYWGRSQISSFKAKTHNSTDLYFGARWGIAYANNVGDLSSKTIVTDQGGLEVTKTADIASQYMQGTIYPGRLDLMLQQGIPVRGGKTQAVGLDFYATKNTIETAQWQPGIALLLFNPSKPLSTLGGVDVCWLNGKSTVGMFVGYSF